jgi:hypothetical protein
MELRHADRLGRAAFLIADEGKGFAQLHCPMVPILNEASQQPALALDGCGWRKSCMGGQRQKARQARKPLPRCRNTRLIKTPPVGFGKARCGILMQRCSKALIRFHSCNHAKAPSNSVATYLLLEEFGFVCFRNSRLNAVCLLPICYLALVR